MEFVANPMGTVIAASVPKYCATRSSSSLCISNKPEIT